MIQLKTNGIERFEDIAERGLHERDLYKELSDGGSPINFGNPDPSFENAVRRREDS